ncbi:MAG: LPS assembly lipoprotein LptE [Pseudomonadota bacterium]
MNAVTRQNLQRPLIVLLMLCALTACGFQLRGTASLPAEMQTTWIQAADSTGLFYRELRLLLEANGVDVVSAADDMAATLLINRERISRRALTVSGDARVREFELVFELQFSLVDADGNVLIAPENLLLARDFQFDEQEILGAASEEELLRDDLRRNMAATLIRRLEAFGRS